MKEDDIRQDAEALAAGITAHPELLTQGFNTSLVGRAFNAIAGKPLQVRPEEALISMAGAFGGPAPALPAGMDINQQDWQRTREINHEAMCREALPLVEDRLGKVVQQVNAANDKPSLQQATLDATALAQTARQFEETCGPADQYRRAPPPSLSAPSAR